MLTSQLRFLFVARLRSFRAYWTIARWTLLIWGALNGLGTGLIGEVKRRVSRRVQRVSGPVSP